MATSSGSMQGLYGPCSQAGVSPCAATSPQQEVQFPEAVTFLPALRPLADGVSARLATGLLYCLVLTGFLPDRLDLARMGALAFALTLCGFEAWRRKGTARNSGIGELD